MADRDSQLGGARNLGLPANRRDRLGRNDLDDLYRVNLTGRSTLELGVSEIARRSNFNVEVYSFKRPSNQIPRNIRNQDFRRLRARDRNTFLSSIGASRKGGNANENLSLNLDAGEYLVRVSRQTGDSRYRLRATATLIPTLPSDTTPPTAALNASPLTTGGGAAYDFVVTYSDNVAINTGTIDGNDIRVTSPSGFNQLATLVSATPGGNGTPRTATYRVTAPGNTWDAADNGTYTVSLQANQVTDTNSNAAAAGALGTFQVNIAATPGGGDPGGGDPGGGVVRDGNSIAGATLVSGIPITLTGSVTNTDTQDFYQITTGTRGDYLIELAGLTADANISIVNADGSSVSRYQSQAGITQEKFIQPLDAGTFYVRVFQSAAGNETNYSLAIGNKLTDTVPNAIATVTPIPIPANNTTTFTGANYVVDGGIDSPVDYYRFRTAPAANSTDRPLLRVQLDDLFGNLDIEVVSLGVDGQPIPGRGGISDASSRSPSGTFGQGSEDFSGILSPDTEYIIRIFAPNGSGEGSTYNLTVDLAVASDIPAKTRGIRPGGESSNPRNVTEVGNFTFFSAEDGSEPSSPNSLWRTDTTIDGTQKFGDFVSLGNFTAAGNSGNNTLLYFVANDGTPNLGNDLFKCDPNGVISRVRDGDDPILSSYADLTAVGDRLYFLAEAGTGTGRRLYRTGVDGTGVELVLTAGGAEILGTRVRDLTAVGDDALFFDGRFGADGSQLAYIQNARTANNTPTEIFLTSTNPPEAVDPNDLVAVSANTLYFTAEPSTLDRKLYRYTIGDAQPTLVSLGGIAPNPGNLIFVEGTSSPNTLYFTADTIDTSSNPVGEELVRIVNPASSTTAELVSNITPDAGSSDIAGLVALDGTGRLAFITIDPADNLSKVWVTDGTDAGTRAITLTGNITEYNPSPTQLAAVGGTIFFAADTPTEGRELWKYDTDATNTLATLVGDINTTDDPSNPDVVPNSNPGSFAVANDTLLFTADDGVDGIELWSVLP